MLPEETINEVIEIETYLNILINYPYWGEIGIDPRQYIRQNRSKSAAEIYTGLSNIQTRYVLDLICEYSDWAEMGIDPYEYKKNLELHGKTLNEAYEEMSAMMANYRGE